MLKTIQNKLNLIYLNNDEHTHMGRANGSTDILQSVSWSLAEFRHNKIVQSPHENYFNVCRQHKEKWDLVKMTIIQTGW